MAIVIALALMAFVILIILMLTTLVQVETRLSASQTQRLQAENNALLGLNMALGELQEMLGPDRRVSATADILTEAQPHKGRNDPVAVTQSYWTGVWNVEGGLRNWLVSGNEGTAAPADLFTDAAPTVTPDDADLAISTILDAGDTVSVAGGKALVLVAAGSAGTNDASAMVVAPEVEIGDSGAYAWWVSDEGVKARVNSVDRYVEDGESSAPARHLSAQRNAIELLSGLDSFKTLGEEALDKLSSADQLGLALPVVTDETFQSHFHDLTLWSKGLLVDVRNGGLKRDLSYLFELDEADFLSELPNLYTDVAGLNPGEYVILSQDDEGTTPIAQMAITTPDWYFDANPQLDSVNFQPWQLMDLPFGPTWEQLRSFYRLKDDVAANTIAIRPQRENQAGVYPVLLQARAFAGISRVMSGMGSDATPGTDDDEMEVFAHFRIMFVLANPYTVDLDISDMNLTFYMRGGDLPVSFTSEVFGRWTHLFNQQRFRISSGTIPAGEARIYTLDRSGADTTANASYPFYEIEASDFAVPNIALVTHELINDFDEFVSLRCQLPGGPYTRAETNNAYLEAGSPGGSDGVVITWGRNPTDYRDILQFSGPIGSGNTDQDAFDGDRFSDYIDATTADGQVAWGGGSRWIMTDASKSIGNHIREVNIRAPYRNANSDPYNPDPGQYIGGQRFPMYTSGVTHAKKFGSEDMLYTDSPDPVRAGWGMLFTSYDGQDPYFVNRLFDIPTGDTSINSIGQLQHFNASGYIPAEPASSILNSMAYTWARFYFNTIYELSRSGVGYDDFPTLHFSNDYAIGNSFSSRYVARDRVYQGDTVLYPRDASWLLNAALWDRFYFSSMPQTGNFDVTADKLINNRYRSADGAVSLSANVLRASATSFAENMGMEGGFNVNSTSPEAWKAFLSGTLGVQYQGENNTDEAVFARTPQQDANPTAGGDPKDPLVANAWKGYRALTLPEIDTLVDEIVNQVKLRGPFLSSEHFVNRLPLASADDPNGIGIKGALEAAIEKANLNPKAAVASSSRLRNIDVPINQYSAVDLAHGFSTTIDGGPGRITQGDLLQPLGPYISVRSDTFRIRSTGVYEDPITGETLSQAWCEAVVQRLPEFVDASQAANSSQIDLNANSANLRFGRRFKMISFRWLDKSEI